MTRMTRIYFYCLPSFVMLTIPLSFIISHAELVSASGYWSLQHLVIGLFQILNQVQDDHAAHKLTRRMEILSWCYRV